MPYLLGILKAKLGHVGAQRYCRCLQATFMMNMWMDSKSVDFFPMGNHEFHSIGTTILSEEISFMPPEVPWYFMTYYFFAAAP